MPVGPEGERRRNIFKTAAIAGGLATAAVLVALSEENKDESPEILPTPHLGLSSDPEAVVKFDEKTNILINVEPKSTEIDIEVEGRIVKFASVQHGDGRFNGLSSSIDNKKIYVFSDPDQSELLGMKLEFPDGTKVFRPSTGGLFVYTVVAKDNLPETMVQHMRMFPTQELLKRNQKEADRKQKMSYPMKTASLPLDNLYK